MKLAMTKLPLGLGAVSLVALAYLLFWPVAIEPVSWVAPIDRGYAGPFAVNRKLTQLKHIELGDDEGPEHVAMGRDGKLYAAMASGNILRMNPDGSGREVFANTGGRPLGFSFDASDNLIVADGFRGLLSITASGKVTLLTDRVDGALILFADAVVIADSGKIYFTDASTRFGAEQWGPKEASYLDIIEQTATGRLLEYDPTTRTTRVIAYGFSFANGVVLSNDQQTLFVAESGRYTVWRIAVDAADLDLSTLTHPKDNAQARRVFDNLPGYPDNLMRGLDGRIWVGLMKPRSAAADDFASLPFLRKIALRLPHAWLPVPKNYVHMVAFTEDGKVVADLQDPDGAYPDATGITETRDRLYVQSLTANTLAWLTPQAAGL